MQCVIIVSKGGALLKRVLSSQYARQKINRVLADRKCEAIEVAKSFGVNTIVYEVSEGAKFSDLLCNEFSNRIPDLVISFYTKLFSPEFVVLCGAKLVNMHPSILPAFPGFSAFERSVKNNSAMIGATVHFVDEGIDTGAPLIQSAVPYDPYKSFAENRHIVFEQQVKMIIQTIKFFDERRIEFRANGRVIVNGSKYRPGEFAPNLDDDLPL